jgi:TRAP-type C4-dicarboxylate transport system permease small subunit
MERAMTVLENWLMWIAFLAALALGVAQVVMRYGFNSGFVWIETVLVALTILAAMAGGSRAAARGLHVRITLMVNSMGARPRIVVNVIALLITLVYCGILAYGGYEYVRFLGEAGVTSVESGLPAWLFAAIVPLTMVMFVIRYLMLLPATLRGEQVQHVEYMD